MRKLVVFVMLMTCVISAQAQWKVTPEAGMNVTKYKGDAAKVALRLGPQSLIHSDRAGSRFNPVCIMCDGGRGCLLIVRFMELVRVHMGDGKVRVYFSIPFPVII